MKRLNSVRTKLVTVPLLLVFLGIAALALVSLQSAYHEIMESKRLAGLSITQHVKARIESNTESIAAINALLGDKILTVGELVVQLEEVNDEILTEIAESLGIDAIHWYNPQGVIIASAYSEYLNWEAPRDHPVYLFLQSGQDHLVEDIRKDSESDNYYKYGYRRAPGGYMVQVGIEANDVQALTDQFSPEHLVADITSGATLAYAAVLDAEEQVAAATPPWPTRLSWTRKSRLRLQPAASPRSSCSAKAASWTPCAGGPTSICFLHIPEQTSRSTT